MLKASKIELAEIISQAMQDRDILSIEFHNVLQEVEKNQKRKIDIRNQAKTKIRQITKEQQEKVLKHGRKEGKEDILRKIVNTSDIQGINAI